MCSTISQELSRPHIESRLNGDKRRLKPPLGPRLRASVSAYSIWHYIRSSRSLPITKRRQPRPNVVGSIVSGDGIPACTTAATDVDLTPRAERAAVPDNCTEPAYTSPLGKRHHVKQRMASLATHRFEGGAQIVARYTLGKTYAAPVKRSGLHEGRSKLALAKRLNIWDPQVTARF